MSPGAGEGHMVFSEGVQNLKLYATGNVSYLLSSISQAPLLKTWKPPPPSRLVTVLIDLRAELNV